MIFIIIQFSQISLIKNFPDFWIHKCFTIRITFINVNICTVTNNPFFIFISCNIFKHSYSSCVIRYDIAPNYRIAPLPMAYYNLLFGDQIDHRL